MVDNIEVFFRANSALPTRLIFNGVGPVNVSGVTGTAYHGLA
jgi:hypothetical protein